MLLISVAAAAAPRPQASSSPLNSVCPFRPGWLKRGGKKTEKKRNFTHSHFPELYLFTWYVWLVDCVWGVCSHVCVFVWWVYSSWALWLVGTGLWFGSWWRARVRVAEHHGCHTATDILAPVGQYKFLFPKYRTTTLFACVWVSGWKCEYVTTERFSDCVAFAISVLNWWAFSQI